MNEATKKKFQDATKDMGLSGAQKKCLVAFYKDDIESGDIEKIDTTTFRMLIRMEIRKMGWKDLPATDGEA